MTYYRYYSESSPMCRAGYAMFAEDQDMVRGYGDYLCTVDGSLLTSIADLGDALRSAIAEGWDDRTLPDDMLNVLDDNDGDIEAVVSEFNPQDIVDWACAWDNWDWVEWFWLTIGEDRELAGITTEDGAIVFDESVITLVGNKHDIDIDD